VGGYNYHTYLLANYLVGNLIGLLYSSSD